MGLFDRVRRHLDPPAPASRQAAAPSPARTGAPLETLGVTGLRRSGGVIYEEDLRELRGARWTAAVRDMTTNDATIGAILFAVEMLIRQVPWTIEPASDAQEDVDAAAFVEECLFGGMEQTWEDTLAEILTMLPWGWSLHELVYARREDGRIGWHGWPIRSQDSLLEWQFDEAGNVVAMVQQAPPDYKTRTIPLDKALLFRTTSHKGNPEGFSMLRRAWRAWNAKRRIENLEGIGVERDLAGLPVMGIPPELMVDGNAIYEQAKAIVTNIRNDEQAGIVMPLAYGAPSSGAEGKPTFELKLLSTGGARQFDTSGIITRYKTDIVMSVLMDFLMVGHEEQGSWALSSSKTKIAATALGGWCKAIAAVPNRKAIPDLLALNGMRGSCKLTHGDIETPEPGPLADAIDKLVKAGALVPDQPMEERLRAYLGLPPVPEDRDDRLADQQTIEDLTAELDTLRQAQRQMPAEEPPAPGEEDAA
jgi:hypothetical protein